VIHWERSGKPQRTGLPRPCKEYIEVKALTILLIGLGLCLGAPCRAAEEDASAAPYFNVRTGLDNCRLQFLKEKMGRVAFIGGSITTMPGWRDLTCKLLENRFADTQFDFINAGIGGTNSTLGAFRLEDDVFKSGPVDLLFLEFAVNDGDEAPDNRAVRAMEGIVRHARRLNPRIDIVMQYFADQGKVAEITKGETPSIITRHEQVAERYGIPVLNLALEMTRRLNAGAFTWEQFSRDSCHPLPFGHQLYADCIDAFLETAWAKPADLATAPVDHPVPEALDPLNYVHGRFIALDKAAALKDWRRIPDWTAEKTCNYSGPVDVLAAEAPGASFELPFEGSLVGMYGIAGMDAGVLECSVDDGPAARVDLFDHYCAQFHRPVCRILAEGLAPGPHVLHLRMADDANPKSQGHAARILKFVAN
jgi:lysophospholipase L1-like esterase